MKEGNEARNENIRRMFSRTAGLAVGLIYPRRCPICDKPVKPAGGLICAECSGIPVRISGPACRKCGKPLRDGNAEYCDDCIRQRHVFESGAAVFRYRSVQNAIYRFKYRSRFTGNACKDADIIRQSFSRARSRSGHKSQPRVAFSSGRRIQNRLNRRAYRTAKTR